jgi:hypothetical protein
VHLSLASIDMASASSSASEGPGTNCVCVRCLLIHPGSDCISVDSVPSSVDGACVICGATHCCNSPCHCVICHTLHSISSDCPLAFEGRVSDWSGHCPKVCFMCGARHMPSSPCPCVRCHYRHPLKDCPKMPRVYSTVISVRVRALASTAASIVEHVALHHCGEMCVICPHCLSRTFPGERINCCSYGEIYIPDLNVVPDAMSAVILSSHVRSNARIYNSVLALSSVGHNNKSLIGGTFVLGGSAYHRIGSIVPGAVSSVLFNICVTSPQVSVTSTSSLKFMFSTSPMPRSGA